MAWVLRVRSKDGGTKDVVLNKGLQIKAESQANYELIPTEQSVIKPLSLKRVVKNKKQKGESDELLVQDDQGALLSITDFFGQDQATQLVVPATDLCKDGAQVARVTPATLFDSQSGQILLTAMDPATSCVSNQAAQSGSSASDWIGGLAFLGGGVAIVSGAGSTAPVVNAVQVSFMGGPTLANHALTIELYAADGSRLLGTGLLDENGQITLKVGTYTGVVIVRVIDGSDGPDYLDEASGEKDLNADLWAMGQIVEANSTIYLNINALTTIAYNKADMLVLDGQSLPANIVTAVNAAVAQAFGLTDLHNTEIVATNSENFDPTETSSGELYGQILAYMAGLDAINAGDTQATIDAFVGNTPTGGWLVIDTSGASTSGSLTDDGDDALTDGANEVALPTAYVNNVQFDGQAGFESSLSAQVITAQLQGSLDGTHSLIASLDGGVTWTNLSDLPGVISGSNVSWSVNIAGGSELVFKVIDAVGNQGPVTTQSYQFTGSVPTTTIGGLDISSDSGSSGSDFTTNIAVQTVTGTLSSALVTGEAVYGSVDNGANWVDITGFVSGTAISWTNVTLASSGTLKLEVRNAIGNAGTPAVQAYIVDTAVPTTTISGLDISLDSGSSGSDFTTKFALQTVTGTLSTGLGVGEKVYGSVDNGANWVDISSFVSGTAISWSNVTLASSGTLKLEVRDAAGNAGTAVTQNYTVDTSAPSAPSAPTSYADDVGSVTSTTSTATTTDDTKPGIVVGANLTTTPTLYVGGVAVAATYDATAGTLTPTNALSAGANVLTYTLTDLAGNESAPSGSLTVTVDTTSPTTTIGGLDISSDSGSSGSDFTTNIAVQTVTGTLSSALVTGEAVYGSVDNGANWVDITGFVSGTAISWTNVTLASSGTLKLEVRNAIGNAGTPAVQAYIVDTAVPTTTISGLDISLDSGSSGSDFTTKFALQTVTGTLSTGLGVGEKVYGSVDNGANWVDISSFVSGTAISWSNVTLASSGTLKLEVRDAAGNAGTAVTQNYTVDTSAPSAPSAPTSYADDVGSVTSTTSTATTTDDTKPGIVVGANLTTTPTLYVGGVAVAATYDATAGTLTPTNALSAGANVLTYTLTDLAGNESAPSGSLTVTVVLAPTTTISALSLSDDTGSSSTDFITQSDAQTVTGTLSAALGTGEKLYGTLDNGTNWVDITGFVSGTTISWTNVTLPSSGTLKLEVRDDEDRAGTATTKTYVVDNTGPTLTGITDNFINEASGEITYRFLFDEAVTGFTTTDIDITAGTKGAFAKVSDTEYTLKVTPPLIGGDITTSVTGAFTDLAGNTGTATATNLQEATGLTAGQSVIDLGASYGKLIKPVYVDGKWYYYWDRNGNGVADAPQNNPDVVGHDTLDALFINDVNGGVNPGSDTTDVYRYATINGLKIALPTVGNPDFIETTGQYIGLFHETKTFSGSSSDTTNYVIGTAIDNNPAGETNTEYDDLMAIWDAFNTSSPYTSNGLPPDWYPYGYWSATASVFGHAYMSLGGGIVYDARDNYFGGLSVAVEVIFPV